MEPRASGRRGSAFTGQSCDWCRRETVSLHPHGGSTTKRLGLIVNPMAGLGGRVGLKGSDGLQIQALAREMGAASPAQHRAAEALTALATRERQVEIVTYPGEMGADVARGCGIVPHVVGSIRADATTAQETCAAARSLRDLHAGIVMFVGGDGTARDMVEAVGITVPVIGVPAGVKMQSAVYAVNPTSAGHIAVGYLSGEIRTLHDAEVIDLDEEAYRRGVVSSRLYGYLRVPLQRRLVQPRKSPSPLSEGASRDAIALGVVESMQDDVMYIIGPGTTTRSILERLGLPKTLIGVDVLLRRRLIAVDANEADLLRLLRQYAAKIVIAPIGGQGFLLGRGNQQLSPLVIRIVGKENLIVVSTLDKILSLAGRPLLVDTDDPDIDRLLSGPMRVTTGYREELVYPVMAPLR